MYFKASGRHNPSTGKHDWYYRLVESYRNSDSRVCHRTLLNIGFLDDSQSTPEQLNAVARLLTDRYQQKATLFAHENLFAVQWAEELWQRMVKLKRIDPALYDASSRKIDTDTMQHSNVRETGAEWMCYNTWQDLKIDDVLRSNGFNEDAIKLAQTQVISRAVYPASELATTRWIQENSAICELTGFSIEKINKDRLYKSALQLFDIKDILEQHLSVRTNELFDIQDKVIIYDLTNTYFEGEKRNSSLARFGRSKEKRSDARLVVLAMVVNVYGFVKYSAIHEGNFADSAGIDDVLNNLEQCGGSGEHPRVVVIDAGIATKENLLAIRVKGYHYLCVSRKQLKDYVYDNDSTVIKQTRGDKAITLRKIQTGSHSDYYLEVHSPDKALKESSMKNQFEVRFEDELQKIKLSLHKKGGVKKLGKVHQRLGRLLQKYPSVHRSYDIAVIPDAAKITATDIHWSKNADKEAERLQSLGKYFLCTSLDIASEELLWDTYNTIREVESTFRTLKTDLDLRPIYHKKDRSTMAHLHLGILAYWLVNTIRCKLKRHKINHSWPEIVRIGNTQKVITTTGYNAANNEVVVRKCSNPAEKLRILQTALGIRQKPFKRLSTPKSVVHKMPNQKKQSLYHSGFGPP